MAANSQQGSNLLRAAQTVVGQTVDRGTGLVADRVEHYSNVAREIGDILRDRGEPQAAEVVQGLSQRATDVARYLRNSDGSRLWTDLQNFARGRTWLLTGVGLVSGMALARAVRTASSGSTNGWDNRYSGAYAQ